MTNAMSKLKFIALLGAVVFGFWLAHPANVVRGETAKGTGRTRAYITRLPDENRIVGPFVANPVTIITGTAIGISCVRHAPGSSDPGAVDCFVLSK